ERSGTAYPVNVSECDLKALVAREVDTNQACHLRAVLLLVSEVSPTAPAPARAGPGLPRGWPLPGRARAAVRLLRHQPWRCLCRGSLQMTMTRPCRRMIRHLLQIFFTLGLTFIRSPSQAGQGPAFLLRCRLARGAPPAGSVTCTGKQSAHG